MALTTEHLMADSAGLDRAVAILKAGGRVAFPTETVYGLGADARNDRAVAGIFEAKNRPHFNPLIAHIHDWQAATRLATFSPEAARLAHAFWPGALTMVLPLAPGSGLSRLVTAGLTSVALRVPAAPIARDLLARFDGPIAAPSANPSGRISPTTAAHVLSGLDGRIEAVLAGDACAVGVESTILDLTGPARLLRPGGLSAEAIEAELGCTLAAPLPSTTDTADDRPIAPGQLLSHYAPSAPVRLNAGTCKPGELLLGFGPVPDATENLSPDGDLTEAAANLFAALHRLDRLNAVAIAVSPIPEIGLGRAINDRLRRAAAPR
ncbi:L-threonylcarbamoyladenylate synthase [Pseudoruegeria sp. SK021]|uniref:L-threonylcarbamoyladenylate synthase n=1 Tax=Pseudoruegeria sp. SK021 TaxID=1933035 RepID=UPI000A241573|nr:L-threonylcarbamoyladenylate synthase [Pseudoruegeria sp. SK021]OSP55667.1 threonylcarbamoyl-AMP synthase [Pseudoruegeria sp. SK021]